MSNNTVTPICACGHYLHMHGGAQPLACVPGCPCQGFTADTADTAELEELRALADTADETAANLWDNYSAGRAELELIRRRLDDMAERAEMASRAADAARGKVRAAMRAAGLVLTADGYAPAGVTA